MPLLVTAADISSALLHTDAAADSIDHAVDGCPDLDGVTRAQWKAFVTGYRAFSQANRDLDFFTLGLPNIGDQVVAYEHELAAWNDAIAQKCPDVAPSIIPHDVARASDGAATQFLVGAVFALGVVAILRR